ncbi:MAG: hypothetical protein AAF517_00670 [Planctomycetota bacterium]
MRTLSPTAVLLVALTGLFLWGGDAVAVEKPLSRDVLKTCLSLGRRHLMTNQLSDGRFRYEYDFVKKIDVEGDNSVRQAGALWGLCSIHRDQPSAESRRALLKGFAFFRAHSKRADGKRFVLYPGSSSGKTGTMALLCLAIEDFLSVEAAGKHAELRKELDEILAFLRSIRRNDGRFAGRYRHRDGSGYGDPSPYSDGETLLALVKSVKEHGKTEWKSEVLASADSMYTHWAKRALIRGLDLDTTKGFYQWGSMAFIEIATAKWKGTQRFARHVVGLAHWMIDIHRTLARRRNTAYAYEGIISAVRASRLLGDKAAEAKFLSVIEEGLSKLCSWQLGSPIANRFLRRQKDIPEIAIGGVMNAKSDPVLRIDVTQHQMHAVVLALKHVYTR